MRLSPSACTAGIRVRAVQASARKVLIARSIVGSLASTCHTQPSAMDTLHQGSTVRLSRVLGPLCVAVLSSFILLQNPQSMASLMTQALLLLSCLVLPTSFVLIHSGLHRRQKIIRIAVLLAAAVAVCGWRTIQVGVTSLRMQGPTFNSQTVHVASISMVCLPPSTPCKPMQASF